MANKGINIQDGHLYLNDSPVDQNGGGAGDGISASRTVTAVDISSIAEQQGFIRANQGETYSNKWLVNSSYLCKLVPVTEDETYKLSGNGSYGSYFAALESGTITSDAYADFASGFSAVRVLGKDDFAYVTIPKGCTHLYVSTTISGHDATPVIAKVSGSQLTTELNAIGEDDYPIHPTKNEVTVAASNAPGWQKANADYLCIGTNDELVIQKAINFLAPKGGRLRLTAGTFYIDSFPNDRGATLAASYGYRYCAIMLPKDSAVEFVIEGDSMPLSRTIGGTSIVVSDSCYEGLSSSTEYAILGAGYINQISARVAMKLLNVKFELPWNQKNILAIDCFAISRVLVQFVTCHGCRSGYNNVTVNNQTPPPVAAEGCIGLRSVGGSNWGTVADFKNIGCNYFYEGFALAGEHIVGINLSTIQNYYGYTFGNFNFTGASTHPMTLINCCDEQNACGPYFAECTNVQQVDLIAFNMEVSSSYCQGGSRIKGATEGTPGKFRGRCEYTIWSSSTKHFWEYGHGEGFLSRNMEHLPACSTSTRATYIPDYMEQVFDTDLNKLVVCVDPENKTWKDTMGNTVSNS